MQRRSEDEKERCCLGETDSLISLQSPLALVGITGSVAAVSI